MGTRCLHRGSSAGCVKGAQLIVVDPRRIDIVDYAAREGLASSGIAARARTVAMVNALAHVIVTEGLVKGRFSSPSAVNRVRSSNGATS